jgi:hypothetical protein
MKLSPLNNTQNNNDPSVLNTPSSGLEPHRNRTKNNQGCGGHNTKYSSPKVLSASTQVHDLLRLRGGTTADMDLSENRKNKAHDPNNLLKYKGASPWASSPAKEAGTTVFHAVVTPNAPPQFIILLVPST